MHRYNRRSIRLKGYNYSQPGDYFVTICTENHKCIFGDIRNGKMELIKYGKLINEYCLITENHFQNVQFDTYVIMPNHFHVIIKIKPPVSTVCPDTTVYPDTTIRARGPRPYGCDGGTYPAPTLGQIVGFFKYGVTKQINHIRNTPGMKLWQRNYYEYIIRDENEMDCIRKYIRNNPLKWETDSMKLDCHN